MEDFIRSLDDGEVAKEIKYFFETIGEIRKHPMLGFAENYKKGDGGMKNGK